MSVEFRIMGIPSRREKFILPMLKHLGLNEDSVYYDYKMERNPLKSAKRAWLPESQSTHVCVLQDDIELCDNFVEIVNICAKKFPNSVFSFYNPRVRPEERSTETPYVRVKGCGMYGPAIMMPSFLIPLVFLWGDKNYGKDYKHDDTVIGFFCQVNKISVMTTNPSIIQHLGSTESALGYNNKNKISKVYQKDIKSCFFDTNKFVESKYIPNTKIEPKGGYRFGRLLTMEELFHVK